MPEPIARERLEQIIRKIESLEEEKAQVGALIKDVFTEAKGTGFDTKALRAVLRRRRKQRAEVEQEDQMIELYEGALT